MTVYRLAVAALATLATTAAVGQAANVSPAQTLAAGCANCHGTNGVSVGVVPSLAGARKSDLAAKMLDYKNGKRTGTIMPQLAKGYTNEQIELVSAWFADQPSPSK